MKKNNLTISHLDIKSKINEKNEIGWPSCLLGGGTVNMLVRLKHLLVTK